MTAEPAFDELLVLEQRGADFFESGHELGRNVRRLFGGHLLAQGLWAAGRAFDSLDRVASSRGLFLRPADPGQPLGYRVSIVKDGRSLTHRRVVAEQAGREVFVLDATFDRNDHDAADVDGPTAVAVPPTVPGPEQAHHDPRYAGSPLAGFAYTTDCFEVRFVLVAPAGGGRAPFHPFWVRGTRLGRSVGRDPLAWACAVAFVSDMGSLSGALLPHEDCSPFQGSSLEHSMWFSRPTDLRDWHLVDLGSALREGRRGVAHGSMADASGRTAAVVTQLGYF